MRSILIRGAILLPCLWIMGGPALASNPPIRQGLYYGEEAAPVLATTVEVKVTGIIARTRIAQVFGNSSKQWREGSYLFPLPDGAAVDTLKMKVGDREIRGEIREARDARGTYLEAREAGKEAALIEQRRPAVFKASVAGIPPGAIVEVAVEMQHLVRYADGKLSLRFPTIAARPNQRWPGGPVVNTFVFHADLFPGLPLTSVKSTTHPIDVEKGTGNRYAVDLKAGSAPAGRDLVLEWTLEPARAPRAVYVMEEVDGERYGLLTVIPPAGRGAPSALPREVTLILDTSESMEGAPLSQLRTSVELALRRLRPGDRFNILQAGEAASALFPASVEVTPEAIEKVRGHVAGLLHGKGAASLRTALQLVTKDSQPLPGFVRQVVVMTDGRVEEGEENFCLCYVKNHLGDRRLFTLGVGGAPNVPFLRRMAELGRGSFTAISSQERLVEEAELFLVRLESPMSHQIEVRWPDPAAETYPARLPDLYLGEPLVVTARLGSSGPAEVSGKRGEEWWTDNLPAPFEVRGAGIAKLWAAIKVRSLMDSLSDGGSAYEVRRTVTELGLRYGLVTEHTSLVTVDRDRPDPAGPGPRILNSNTEVWFLEPTTVTGETPLLDEGQILAGSAVTVVELEAIPTARDPWAILQAQTSPANAPDDTGSDNVGEEPPCVYILDIRQAGVHRERAKALARAGKLAEAEAEYVRAMAWAPTDEQTWLGLEALGRIAGFTVNRLGLGRLCQEAFTEPSENLIDEVEQRIQQRVIVR